MAPFFLALFITTILTNFSRVLQEGTSPRKSERFLAPILQVQVARNVPSGKQGYKWALFDILIKNKPQRRAISKDPGILNRIQMAILNVAHFVGRQINLLICRLHANTIHGSQFNISAHYDLGNDLFELFLDESMTYSCALWQRDDFHTLYEAQMNKLDAIIDRARINDGDKVLEIGSGWGSCGHRAASVTKCNWYGVTLSEQQLSWSRKLCNSEKLKGKLQFELQDYRKIDGSFDKVISIEMIEAVGAEFLPTYFQVIHDKLKPGGLAVIQAILCPEEFYAKYCHEPDFIKKHIFPGGHMPSMEAIVNALPQGLELLPERTVHMGKSHYTRTLDVWRDNFDANEEKIQNCGYNETFCRKWRYYLSLCASLFANEYIDDVQLVFRKLD